MLQDLMDSLEKDSIRESGAGGEKRSEGEAPEASPPHNALKMTPESSPGRPSESEARVDAIAASTQPIRMVVAGEILEDGDEPLSFPDHPPELDPILLAKIEDAGTEEEVVSLVIIWVS